MHKQLYCQHRQEKGWWLGLGRAERGCVVEQPMSHLCGLIYIHLHIIEVLIIISTVPPPPLMSTRVASLYKIYHSTRPSDYEETGVYVCFAKLECQNDGLELDEMEVPEEDCRMGIVSILWPLPLYDKGFGFSGSVVQMT